MKEFIKKNKYLLLGCVIVFAYYYFRLSRVDLTVGDDPWFRAHINDGVFNFVHWRWLNWSSRVFLEGILLIMLDFPVWVWRIITTLMFVLIFYSILKLIDKKQSPLYGLLTFLLMISINFSLYGSAGWYATTINYVWVFGLGIYVLSFIPELLKGKKFSLINWVLFLPSLLISINQEQMCALVFGFYGIAWLYYWYKNKHINIECSIVMVMTFGMLCIHGFCPGNALRKIAESDTFYPLYGELTLVQKVYIGTVATIASFLSGYNIQLIILLLIICILGFLSNKIGLKILGLIPLLAYIVMKIVAKYTIFLNSTLIYESTNGVDLGIPSIGISVVLLMVFILLVSLIGFFVTLCTCRRTISVTCLLIFCAAFCCRMIMGFSASVFVSGMRTFIFTYYLIGIGDLILIISIQKRIANLQKKELLRRKTI